MQVNIDKTNAISKDLTVLFDWNEVAATYEQAFKKLHKNLELPGFRKGKVPVAMAKRQLEHDLELEVIDQVVKENFEAIIKQAAVENFLDFTITNFKCKEKEPLELKLKVEFDPQFELPNYQKGFKIVRKQYIVDPESVDEVIERIREEHSTVKEIAGPVAEGNLVECDLQQLDESNLPIIGQKLTDKVIKVGEGIFGGPDANGLIGAMTGDQVQVRLPHQDGQKKSYAINIKRIHEQTFPEIDDAFVKATYQGVENVAELREQIKKSLEKEYGQQAETELRNAIRDYFIDNTDFVAPPYRVSRYVEYLLEDYKKRQKNQDIDEEEARNYFKPHAERTVRWYLIQRAIREQAEIKVEKPEIEQRIAEIKALYPESEQQKISDYFNNKDNQLDLIWEILEDKIFAHLKKYAKEKVETVHTKELNKELKAQR